MSKFDIATDPRTWIYGTSGIKIANDIFNNSNSNADTAIGGSISIMRNINENYVLPKLIEMEQNKKR